MDREKTYTTFETAAKSNSEIPSGRVRFDDRGNATWETWRGRRLEHPGLALADEEPSPDGPVRVNTKGGRIGYNPYDSGMVKKKDEDKPKKKDLRALSK